MKRKRILSLGLLSLGLCLVLSACGAASMDKDEWYASDVNDSYFDKIEAEIEMAPAEKDMAVQDVPYAELRKRLLVDKQVLAIVRR